MAHQVYAKCKREFFFPKSEIMFIYSYYDVSVGDSYFNGEKAGKFHKRIFLP